MKKLLSVVEVAEFLGVSEACIRKWILERKICFVKVGNHVRFSPEYIERISREGLAV